MVRQGKALYVGISDARPKWMATAKTVGKPGMVYYELFVDEDVVEVVLEGGLKAVLPDMDDEAAPCAAEEVMPL